MSAVDYFDSPDLAPTILGLVAALMVALAVFGLVDLDDTKTNAPTTTVVEVAR